MAVKERASARGETHFYHDSQKTQMKTFIKKMNSNEKNSKENEKYIYEWSE